MGSLRKTVKCTCINYCCTLQAANALSENLSGSRCAVLEREKALMAELKLREKQWRLEQEEQQQKTGTAKCHFLLDSKGKL